MTKHLVFISLIFLCQCLLSASPSHAQSSDTNIDDIENLFTKDAEPTPAPESVRAQSGDSKTSEVKKPEAPLKDVSDLGKLQPFDDVAVIQRRFLPKSERWELFVGPSLNLNDAFFLSLGAAAKIGYNFVERYGVEFTYVYLSTSERQVTEDLKKRGVKTTSFVSPQGFYGLDFKWAPSYGKITWANKKITPFDMYFSFGGGMTPTNQSSSEATLHLATGQIFALSKASAFRWDVSWFMYQASSGANSTRSLYHNVLFTVGWSWFFPEAKYR